MLDQSIVAAFIATSALALGIDLPAARHIAEDRIECLRQDARISPQGACMPGVIATVTE